MVFSLERGGVYIVKVGQPIVVVDHRCQGSRIAWKLVMPDGSMCWCEWIFQINGRWSKKFSLETG
jgi:hypothetical protein